MSRPRLPQTVRVEVRPLSPDERAAMEADAATHRAEVDAHAAGGRRLGLLFALLLGVVVLGLWGAVASGRETPKRAGIVTGVGCALLVAGAVWQRSSERGERALIERAWRESIEEARVIEIDALVHGLVGLDGLVLLDLGQHWWLMLDDDDGKIAASPGRKLNYRTRPDGTAEVSLVGGDVQVRTGTFDWTALPDGHPLAEASPPVFYRAKDDPVAGILPFELGWVVRDAPT